MHSPSLLSPKEAKVRLGSAELTTPSSFYYLVASTSVNDEEAAPVAFASNNRSEGGTSNDVSLARCSDCLRQFATRRGLSIHRQSAHLEEYHLKNVPKEGKKARWDHEEMVLLARREIDLLAAGGKVNVNMCLAEAFPKRTLEAIKGVRRRPAYKEPLRNLTTSTRTQDSVSSLPPEGPSMGSEAHQASSEEWTHDWAADLKKVVEESGIKMDGLRLDDIKPGVPSDWVREALDANYEAWLPAPTEVGRNHSLQLRFESSSVLILAILLLKDCSVTCMKGYSGQNLSLNLLFELY